MPKIRWSAALTLLGALGYLIATIFHPPLTDPWDTGFAFHEVVMHHHWVLDHWVFFLGLAFWYIGLARQSNIHSISNDHTASGGLCAASCFIGSFVMWMMILTVEIAVFPPLTQRIIIKNDQVSKEIWNASESKNDNMTPSIPMIPVRMAKNLNKPFKEILIKMIPM